MAWRCITTDQWVISIVENGYLLEFTTLPSSARLVVTPPFPSLIDKVQSLLDKLAIEPVHPDCWGTGFHSRYFLVPKVDRGIRPIMVLRDLNVFLRDRKF